MTIVADAHIGPWTEEDLLALPEDTQRYELLEGSMIVSPPAGGPHQLTSWKLTGQLKQAVPAGLEVVEALGVRLPEGSLFIPDIVVAERDAVLGNRSGILDPAIVNLVVEIVSPESRTMDRVTKPPIYASAGIGAFWLVELDADPGPAIHAYSLRGDTLGDRAYVKSASAGPGELLVLEEPFPISIDPASIRG
ncbi:MAG: Uma2 family endonuclease [Acidimicrobiales bacterium]